ncbi:MAG: hypothetical protein KAR47_12670 [Planctomycetes bacterium]|nr:hypothetical protein [Planctomycetota bacterium]
MKDKRDNHYDAKMRYLVLTALCLALAPFFLFVGDGPISPTRGLFLLLSFGSSIVIATFVLSSSKRCGIQTGPWLWVARITRSIVLALMIFVTVTSIIHTVAFHKTCKKTITKLGKAIMADVRNHDGKISKTGNWCDLLVQDQGAYEGLFICPNIAYVNGVSSYALNENVIGLAISDINPDTVLLFESKQGWNQTGGSELLTLENHDGKGCYVLFADQHVEYIKSKTVDELRWSP